MTQSPSTPLPAPDRVPPLAKLLRADDLERCVRPFLAGAVDGVLLFAASGEVHGGATEEACPMRRWEFLPPEAEAAVRRGPSGTFGLGDHGYDVRSAYAGTERVGVLVVARRAASSDARDRGLVEGIGAMVGQLLHAGFATWVTSELHLATSESHFRALAQRNDELERAVAHLRELDELKSNFLATVSHELRTPLTTIIGFAEMLLEGLAGDLNEEQSDFVRTILHRGEELLELISQVLEMSRLEVGAVRLNLQSMALREALSRAVETVQLSAVEKDVTLVDDLGDPPFVLADPEKLQRILVNLLGNAIKFSRHGGRVTVAAGSAPIRRPFREETLFGEEADDALRISVHDDGIGIPSDKLEHVFEAFYQVDASPTREHGGAGLGLSIVRNLVQAHGGEAWAESDGTAGTTIHFTLPLAATAPESDA